MKPSEYYLEKWNKLFKPIYSQREYLDFVNKYEDAKYNIFLELDKRFIDREELKDKINKKIREYNYQLGEFSYTKKYRQIKEERIEELKEILELIDK